MIIAPLPTVTLRDLALANPDSLARTAGCHVTQVIYDGIMPAVDPLKWRAGRPPMEKADSENWQEAGFIWEDTLSAIFAARALLRQSAPLARWRPGEMTRDGIIGSPDAIVYGLDDYPDVPEAGVLEEYKCTWKSAKAFDLYDKRYFPWLLQIQSYLAIIGTTEARLYVLHINGEYEGFIPEVRAHRLVFTPQEIELHWRSMVNTAKKHGWI